MDTIRQLPWSSYSNGRDTHINEHSIISGVEFYTKCCCALKEPDVLSVESYVAKATQKNLQEEEKRGAGDLGKKNNCNSICPYCMHSAIFYSVLINSGHNPVISMGKQLC